LAASGRSGAIDFSLAAAGRYTAAVLTGLGLAEAEIAALLAAGAVAA
jgi:hypothetical protein